MADQFIMNYFRGHSKGGGVLGAVSETIIAAEDDDDGKRTKRKWMGIYNNSTTITMWVAFDNAGPAAIGQGTPIRPGEHYEMNILDITSGDVHAIAEAAGCAYSWHIGT